MKNKFIFSLKIALLAFASAVITPLMAQVDVQNAKNLEKNVAEDTDEELAKPYPSLLAPPPQNVQKLPAV